MLSAHQLHINGRRHTLLPSTTLEASRGEVLLIQGDGQESRTALALALTGRMKPSSGSVVLGHDDSMATLRKRSAIVDSPEVNAPENHLTVRSLVAEDLALVPWKFRDRTRPTAWLVKHGFRDILDKWVEQLAPERLLQLQLELALANQYVDLLVVDSPDRHSHESSVWLPLLEQAAAGELGLEDDAHAGTPPRELIVIATVANLPDGWEGPTAVIGQEPSVEILDDEIPPLQILDVEIPSVQILDDEIPPVEILDDEIPPEKVQQAESVEPEELRIVPGDTAGAEPSNHVPDSKTLTASNLLDATSEAPVPAAQSDEALSLEALSSEETAPRIDTETAPRIETVQTALIEAEEPAPGPHSTTSQTPLNSPATTQPEEEASK